MVFWRPAWPPCKLAADVVAVAEAVTAAVEAGVADTEEVIPAHQPCSTTNSRKCSIRNRFTNSPFISNLPINSRFIRSRRFKSNRNTNNSNRFKSSSNNKSKVKCSNNRRCRPNLQGPGRNSHSLNNRFNNNNSKDRRSSLSSSNNSNNRRSSNKCRPKSR